MAARRHPVLPSGGVVAWHRSFLCLSGGVLGFPDCARRLLDVLAGGGAVVGVDEPPAVAPGQHPGRPFALLSRWLRFAGGTVTLSVITMAVPGPVKRILRTWCLRRVFFSGPANAAAIASRIASWPGR
jgi:hypothetical protein